MTPSLTSYVLSFWREEEAILGRAPIGTLYSLLSGWPFVGYYFFPQMVLATAEMESMLEASDGMQSPLSYTLIIKGQPVTYCNTRYEGRNTISYL